MNAEPVSYTIGVPKRATSHLKSSKRLVADIIQTPTSLLTFQLVQRQVDKCALRTQNNRTRLSLDCLFLLQLLFNFLADLGHIGSHRVELSLQQVLNFLVLYIYTSDRGYTRSTWTSSSSPSSSSSVFILARLDAGAGGHQYSC